MAKIDNMMSILWTLSTDKKITAKQIAEKLEINIRTVYRYIDALSASGIPIISDSGHNGGYTLLNSFVKAPLFFNAEEQTALIHSAYFAKETGYFLSEALEEATSKIKINSNPANEAEENRWFEVIKPVGKTSTELLLKKLKSSITKKLSVEIEYRTGHEEKLSNRIINPYGIVYWNNNWYIAAFCNTRKEIRSFRVDRINSLKETNSSFERPKEFSASKFMMGGLLEGNKEKYTQLIIEGNRNTLEDLCKNWYLGNFSKDIISNRAIFLLEKEIIYKYIPNILIPYGKSIKIIEPISLKEKMIEILSDLINYYKN